MKKLVVLFIASSLALASCSKDEIMDDLNHKEVKADDLTNHSWKVKHIKIHEANLDGKKLNEAEKTTLEGLIKMSDEKIVLQKENKMYFKFNDNKFDGTWKPNADDNKWDIVFDHNSKISFGTDATLQIRNGRLYFKLEGMDYTIKNKHYVIEKIEFELIRN
jgi:glutamine cyclotransferase